MPLKAHRPRNNRPANLQTLPTELVQEIATNLDDSALFSFASASSAIRRKTLYTYGERFFTTIKFCLYSHSLQTLTDISTSQFIKHVQYVAFGTEDIGLIGPLHDGEFRRGIGRHRRETLMMPYENDELLQLRMRSDAGLICQALSEFPKLRMVLVGRNPSLDGRPIRESWGAKRLELFNCPYGHCKPSSGMKDIRHVFQTIGMALEQMRPMRADIKLGIEFGRYDYLCLQGVPMTQEVWYRGGDAHRQVTHLRLALHPDTADFESLRIEELAHASGIESMEVDYGQPDVGFQANPAPTIHVNLLPLPQLQRIIFESLWAKPSAFVDFIHSHRDRLTHVSLKFCSVIRYRMPPGIHSHPPALASPDLEPNWLPVIRELQNLPHLTFLLLDHLETDTRVGSHELKRNNCVDKDMALTALWEGKDEIRVGLHFLMIKHSAITDPSIVAFLSSLASDRTSWRESKNYLNMRYANFKASTAYKWTAPEAKALVDFRHCNVYCSHPAPEFRPIPMVDDHTQFPVPGFYEEMKMPVGHHILPPLLWGKWKTVWLSSAR